MFPNPQDALPVPARPNLDHYKTRAKDLVKAVNSPDPAALNQFVRTWLHSLLHSTSLSITSQLPVSVDRWTDELSSFLRTEQQSAQAFTLARAQFILARIHGFQSWPKFARHLQALSLVHSPEAKFESAVEAIIRGELAALEHLLSADPSLVRARSAREHHATLLHYVGANGIEGYRQKTPKIFSRLHACFYKPVPRSMQALTSTVEKPLRWTWSPPAFIPSRPVFNRS